MDRVAKNELYEFGPFRLDPGKQLLLRNGQPVPLAPKSFETLLVLVRHSQQVVSKDDLMRTVWPDTFVEENNLSRNIFLLRKALGENGRYIVTQPGHGYRFAEHVRVVAEQGAELVLESHSCSELVIEQSKASRWTSWAAGLLMLLLIAGISAYQWRRSRLESRASRPAPSPLIATRRSLAVLGFQNLSGDPKAAWLSTAFSEMMATELAAGEQLRLVSSEEVAKTRISLSLPDTDALSKATLARVRDNLRADLIVLGSFSTLETGSGAQIRLDLRVQDTVIGETIVSISETGRETDLFQLVSQAGARLRQRLDLQELLPMQAVNIRASLPADHVATRLYAEGLDRLRIFDAVGARDLLLKALSIEPKFALGHSALAEAFRSLGYESKARDEASRAFQLSQDLSREDRLLVEGQYRVATHEWDRAIEAYRALSDLFPDNLEYGLRLAGSQISASKSRDALATLNTLRKLPAPIDRDPRIDIAESLAWDRLGQYEKQRQVLESAVAKSRAQGARLMLAQARSRLCWVLSNMGESQEAGDSCREAEQIYAATGDARGEEDTLRRWGDAVADSDPMAGIRLYQQALSIAKRIGNVGGQGAAINETAVQYGVLGDHAAAKNWYLESLAIYRQLGDRMHETAVMGNVAGELLFQGKLAGSMKMHEDCLQSARRLGIVSTEGYASYSIGLLLQLQGELVRAKEWFNKSLTLFKRADDRVASTYPLYSLGELALTQADFDGARKLLQQSLSARQEQQEKVGIAKSNLELALLSINEGHSLAEAEASARNAAQALRDAKVKDDEARAYAILSSALLAEGRSAEALRVADQAIAISSKSQDPNFRLSVAVTTARVRGLTQSTNRASVLQALNMLDNARAQAGRLGYVGIQLEAGLAFGEVEMKSGNRVEGRNCLTAVEKEATSRGFLLVAREAAAID